MQLQFGNEKPIYLQVAEQIEDAIFSGAFPEGQQIPSTTEISTQCSINPATVLKGMGILVDQGILHKRRGVGMFVSEGAIAAIREKRQGQFFDQYVLPLLHEAKKLNLRQEQLITLIERGQNSERN